MIQGLTPGCWARIKENLAIASELGGHEREAFLCSLGESDPEVAVSVRDLFAADGRVNDLATLPLWKPAPSRLLQTIPPGELLGDRFEIRELIGSGGSGEVYRAYDRNRRLHLALKTVNASLIHDPNTVAALRNELNTASQVSHPNVCRLFDIFIPPPGSPGRAFITMELLQGETLEERLVRSPLPPQEAAAIVSGIAAGLHAAHCKQIVHRDLKPSNVMLVPDGRQIRPVILDFGIARELNSAETLRASITGEWCAGTPAYMAPELLEGKVPAVASDVHSLGVILFQIVTRRLPFEGESPMAAALKRISSAAPRARIYTPTVDRRWEYAISRCLERDPSRRPRSALEVVSLLSGRPPFAWAQRRFLPGIALAVAFAVALAVIRPAPVNPAAQADLDHALMSMASRTGAGYAAAIDDLKRATALAPKWPVAWADLAYAYARATNARFTEGRSARSSAKAAALKAIQLDSRLARAHGVLGWTQSFDFDDWVAAESTFQKAIQLDPADGLVRYWFAVHLRKKGRFKDAEAQLTQAMQLTHLQDSDVWNEFAFLYWTEGNLNAMRKHMARQLVVLPNVALTRFLNARLLKLDGHFAAAEEELDFSKRLGANPATTLVELASLKLAQGNRPAAEKALSQLERMRQTGEIDGLLMAGVYASLGKFDQAFAVLNAAYERRDSTLLSLATSPVLAPLRPDPRFRTLLAKLHFSPQIMQQVGFSSSSVNGARNQPSFNGTL